MASWSNVEEIEIKRLRSEVERLRGERDEARAKQVYLYDEHTRAVDLLEAAEARIASLEAALRDAIEGYEGTVLDFWRSPLGKRLEPLIPVLWPNLAAPALALPQSGEGEP